MSNNKKSPSIEEKITDENLKRRALYPIIKSDVINATLGIYKNIFDRHNAEKKGNDEDLSLTEKEFITLLLCQIYFDLEKILGGNTGCDDCGYDSTNGNDN